jgi:flagellar hook assembly protein FlgD
MSGGSPGEDDLFVLLTGTSKKLVTIYQNYPNPFSEITKLHYELHEDASVQLSVIDFTGKHIITLEDTKKPAGYYEIEWEGLNGNNRIVDNGFYFYRIVVKNQKGMNTLTRKMLLIR